MKSSSQLKARWPVEEEEIVSSTALSEKNPRFFFSCQRFLGIRDSQTMTSLEWSVCQFINSSLTTGPQMTRPLTTFPLDDSSLNDLSHKVSYRPNQTQPSVRGPAVREPAVREPVVMDQLSRGPIIRGPMVK